MVRGLKQTSEIVTISGSVTETVAGTLAETTVNLSLDVLSREVFVIVATDLNMSLPDANVADNETLVRGSLSTTSRSTVGTLADSNTFATGRNVIVADPLATPPEFVGIYSDASTETPHAELQYIAILSTNDFYAQVKGDGNTRVKGNDFRVWGYRATVTDPAIFAALVQSELLSE
jgi:hypothetical protein